MYAGDKGWTLDRSGVEEMPASDIAAYQEQLKNDAKYNTGLAADLFSRVSLNKHFNGKK